MTNMKSTKRALLSSVLALFLCVAMLVGTTFAWFTDSVTSANNIIKSGNLDIELEYWNGTAWADVKDASDILTNTLWEPGTTEVAYLRLANAGTLALKYQLGVNIVSETAGKNVAGTEFKLSDYLNFAVNEGVNGETAAYATRDAAVEAVTTAKIISDGYTKAASMESGDELYFAMVVYMPTTVGNEANHNGTDVPQIDLGINVIATQVENEEDSFDENYDKDAPLDFAPVSNVAQLQRAIDKGETNIVLINDIAADTTINVSSSVNIDGAGYSIGRPASGYAARSATFTGNVFNVKAGETLTLTDITVDGGAVWTGEINPYLQRGTVNNGATATGALVATEANAHLVLGEGAVLQNNDGANAVNLGTRAGATLTINGGEIINNHSAAGAIWGGGAITLNSGKVNGNHGGIGGAIRAVTNIGTILTMNGGEMNHNYSDGNGGAIWAGSSKSNNVYVLNGGEMAYNYSATTGGAIYAGYYETVKIGGTFKMHDNSCAASIGAEIRFHDHASLVMTGGEVSSDAANALYLNNNSASITGGKIVGNFGYSGGLGLTIGEAEIEGVIAYNLATNHNTAYLAAEFNSFKFTVNAANANFAQFNFKPADGYTYTEGDEAKLICMNEGYETYWDAATGTFRLQAK